MRRRLLTYIGTLRVRRLILIVSTLVPAGILLLALLVASLPALISTAPVQSLMRLGISKAMKQPVSWADLKASWSRGIAISGLTIGEGPPPLLHATLERFVLDPGLSRDPSGRWCVSVDLKLVKLAAELAPGPPKAPVKPLKDPLTQIAEAVQRFQTMQWPLPVDVRLTVDAAPVTLQYADPASKRELLLNDFTLGLAVPSLEKLPMKLSLAGKVAVDGKKPQPVRIDARISGLVASDGRIRPAGARVAARGALPGVALSADGGVMRPEGLSAKLRLSLAEVGRLAAPFAGKKGLPDLGGSVVVALRGETDRAGDLRLALGVDGERLAVSRFPGKRGGLAPLELHLHQKLVGDHKRGRVTFSDGGLSSPGLVAASWRAVVDRPTFKDRTVSAELDRVRLDLARVRQVAAPFLPPRLPVGELEGTATLERLTARLQGPANDGELAVSKLELDLPRVALSPAAGPVRAESVVFSLDKAVVPLRTMTPVKVAAELSWSAGKVEAAGKKPVRAQGMRGRLALSLTGIDLKAKRALIDGSQTLGIERLAVGDDLTLERLEEQAAVKARTFPGGALDAALPSLRLSAATVRARQRGKTVTLRPLAVGLTAEGVHLPAKGKGSPTVARATCTVSASDALALSAEGSLTGQGRQLAATKGEARLDLGRLMPVAGAFLPAGFDAAGRVGATWDAAVPLPTAPLPRDDNPLRRTKGSLALPDRAEVVLKLDGVDLRVPTAQGTCRVKGLGTLPQLRLLLPGGDRPLAVDGGLSFAALEGLSGAAGTLPLQSGTLTLQGELAKWKELRVTEELKVASLGLSQVAELTVGRVDALLEDQGGKLDAATFLKRLDATMFAHMEGYFPPEAKKVLAGWQLSGNVAAGARVDLTAARELRVRGYAKCRDLGVADGKGLAASGIRADLVADRSYALARVKGDDWEPLSAALVRPAPVAPRFAADSDLARRVYEDLRGESGGPRKIGVRRASFRSGTLPLAASALEADLLLEPDALGVSFFQAEFGGGTVRARGMLDLSGETPLLTTYCYFSKLDPVLLFPAAGANRPGGEGELTGELSLSAPLAADRRALLEGMRMNLNLRRFSSRILDRALFAMDPYQRNEKIVAQRNSLRLADLKGLRVTAVDGALDCEGEAAVKGVDLALPRIERLRLSELPIEAQLKRITGAIASSRMLTDLVRADTLVVDEKGRPTLKRRNREP